MAPVEILAMIADERRQTADLIETLSPEQLRTPSLCAEWTVHDVAAHLYASVATSLASFLWAVLRSGMNPHRANVRVVTAVAARCSAADLAAGLREHAETPFEPPFVGYLGPLTDLLVHGHRHPPATRDLLRPADRAAAQVPGLRARR